MSEMNMTTMPSMALPSIAMKENKMSEITNHQFEHRQIALSSFNELYAQQTTNEGGSDPWFQNPLYPRDAENSISGNSLTENSLAAQIQNTIANLRTRNDYSPATLESIKQKIDTWQTDINTLRANGNNQTADQAEAEMLQALSTFQQTLDTAHNKTLQQAQAQTPAPASDTAMPEMPPESDGM